MYANKNALINQINISIERKKNVYHVNFLMKYVYQNALKIMYTMKKINNANKIVIKLLLL